MTKDQAFRIINDSRRFQVNGGKIVVREVALAKMVAAVKAERAAAETPSVAPLAA